MPGLPLPRAAVAVLGASLLAALTLASPAWGDASTPGGRWDKVTPASVGLDAATLDRIAAQARTGKSIQIDPGTRTVVVRLGTAELIPSAPTFGPDDASRVVRQAVIDK